MCGGSRAVSWLFNHPGASRALIEAQIPYDEQALDAYLGRLGPHRVVEETARAILKTAAENMADAIRLMTVERGIDNREFTLIAFGGAGPLHAVEVAELLSMNKVVVPPHPGLCSALGTLLTDLRVDRARTVIHRSDHIDLATLNDQFAELAREAVGELKRDGLEGKSQVSGFLSMRYVGQNFGEMIGSGTAATVPEPSSLMLLSLVMMKLVVFRFGRRGTSGR